MFESIFWSLDSAHKIRGQMAVILGSPGRFAVGLTGFTSCVSCGRAVGIRTSSHTAYNMSTRFNAQLNVLTAPSV